MTLSEIYNEFTPGSTGFCKAVASHCGFGTSDEETARIALAASTAEEFQSIWENKNWWTDANDDAE